MVERTGAEAAIDELGGDGPLLHFAHANGVPPGCYTPLLTRLTAAHRVFAAHARPLWPDIGAPTGLRRWNLFADDLLATLDARGHDGPIIGVGHSLGAVTTLIAAAREPERFKALVLIEPVFLPARILNVFGLLPKFLRYRLKLVRSAAQRSERFPSHDEVFRRFRPKGLFKGIDDADLHTLIAASFHADGDGVTLTYPRAWEAAVFANPPRPWGVLPRVRVPVLGFRGGQSNTVFPDAWRRWQRLQPHGTFVEVPDTGHMLPLQEPDAVASRITQWTQALTG